MQDKNWSCDTCKEKRLQHSRNCPFLPSDTPKDPNFKIYVKNESYKECPKGLVDNVLLANAIEAHEVYSSGFLPEAGTLYDQTQFFVRAALIVKHKMKEREVEAMKTSE